MTEQEAVNELQRVVVELCADEEIAHGRADQILIEFLKANGFKTVADQYESTRDQIGFWYA